MPAPSSSLATLRPDLAGSLEEFDLDADRQNFIGHQVFPMFEVAEAAGAFGRIPVEQLLQTRETRRAPSSGYSRGNWLFEPDSFATEEHGAEEIIDDNQANIYRDYFDAELVATRRVRDAVLRNAEIRIATALFNATVWTGASLTTAVGTPWSTIATADPVSDVDAAKKKVWASSGMWPNALVLNRHNYLNLRRCTKVLDYMIQQNFADARPSKVTPQILASVFDLDYVIVAGGTKNTAAEGQAASFGKIWSDSYAQVCRIATTNDIAEPCVGRAFVYKGDGGMDEGQIETYRDETVRGNVVRHRHQVQEKRLYVECGHLLSNIG